MTYEEKIVDALSGEETIKPYSSAQIAETEAGKIIAAQIANEITKAEEKKATAMAKLQALGLTADDLKALGL